MKSLVFSDLHNKTEKIDGIIAREAPDEAIFPGDYFDSLKDNEKMAEKTARWLKARLHLDGYLFCLGNHDANYRWPKCPWHETAAYTKNKQDAIDRVLTKKDWQRTLFAVQRGNWWITHAGLHPKVFPVHPFTGLDTQKTWDMLHRAEFLAECGLYTPITDEQWNPEETPSGPLWLRWGEFIPIPGINQIVGHTAHDTPQEKRGIDSINWNLDTHQHHYGILHWEPDTPERTRFEIREITD